MDILSNVDRKAFGWSKESKMGDTQSREGGEGGDGAQQHDLGGGATSQKAEQPLTEEKSEKKQKKNSSKKKKKKDAQPGSNAPKLESIEESFGGKKTEEDKNEGGEKSDKKGGGGVTRNRPSSVVSRPINSRSPRSHSHRYDSCYDAIFNYKSLISVCSPSTLLLSPLFISPKTCLVFIFFIFAKFFSKNVFAPFRSGFPINFDLFLTLTAWWHEPEASVHDPTPWRNVPEAWRHNPLTEQQWQSNKNTKK